MVGKLDSGYMCRILCTRLLRALGMPTYRVDRQYGLRLANCLFKLHTTSARVSLSPRGHKKIPKLFYHRTAEMAGFGRAAEDRPTPPEVVSLAYCRVADISLISLNHSTTGESTSLPLSFLRGFWPMDTTLRLLELLSHRKAFRRTLVLVKCPRQNKMMCLAT
jgi:hypothetical protein